MNKFVKALFVVPFTLFAASVLAVPVLQLGPTAGDSGAYYGDCGGPETWCLGSDEFNVYFAPGQQDVDQSDTVYLVFSAVPATDTFTVAPADDGGPLTLVDSGFGTPPTSDPNDLAPHSIFDANYAVYALTFDGPLVTVPDTQPISAGGSGGTADGWVETIMMNAGSPLPAGGIHIDAFLCGSGTVLGGDCQITQGWQVAPFSHDATYVPVPAAVWLFGSGLIGLVAVARRRKNV